MGYVVEVAYMVYGVDWGGIRGVCLFCGVSLWSVYVVSIFVGGA